MPVNPNGGDLKCSPGIWRHVSLTPEIVGQSGCSIAITVPYFKSGDVESDAQQEANGHMLAASKDLYVNLVTLVDCLETINAEVLSTPINLDHILEAKAALKKARGGK